MADKTDPFHPLDDAAKGVIRDLLTTRHAALGTLDPETGFPVVTRIAFGLIGGMPHTLVSDLSSHSAALRADPRASLLVGEPGAKGDPLTHPRLTLQVQAEEADKAAGKDAWLAASPKAQLYYDFGDFRLLRLVPVSGLLNAGFGKAYRLSAEELAATLA